METLYSISFITTVLGAINWGLVGIGGFVGKNLNIISFLSRGNSIFEYVAYLIIGILAIFYLWVSSRR